MTAPTARGENACTAFEFKRMLEAGAVTYAQPSVTKVGGISQMLKVIALAETSGVRLMPHCPYFGLGLVASMHVAAAMKDECRLELFYLDLEAQPMGELAKLEGTDFVLPPGPGLGGDPDPDVLKDYRSGS